ncbi:MAG: pilus assembly protein TadG, partial [Planctomycetes bacterium]|nr:pilus assembly protein TadG [Planctomycetota bacterium]
MRGRRGQVIVLFAGLVVLLLGMCALAVDVGMLHATQARLQNAADAAALAAALQYVQERNAAASESEARTAATSQA